MPDLKWDPHLKCRCLACGKLFWITVDEETAAGLTKPGGIIADNRCPICKDQTGAEIIE